MKDTPIEKNTWPPREGRRRVAKVVGYTIFLGVLFSLHIVPRPARPYLFPLPKTEPRAVALELSKDRARLEALGEAKLPHDVRVVGEEYRRESSLEARKATDGEFSFDVARLLRAGRAEDLLRLRALQCELFMRALARQPVHQDEASRELVELGGDFWLIARSSWIDGERFLLTDDELRVLFRIRWSKLAGVLEHPTLGISLPELRAYYSAMLRHPPEALGKGEVTLARLREPVVYRASAIDPDYPVGLASGLDLLSLGQPELARQAFDAELGSGRSASKSLRLAHHRIAAGP